MPLRSARQISFAAAFAILLPAAAHADCVYKPFAFFPEKNGGVVVDVHIEDGSPCVHRFAEGPGYKFTGVSVELEPEQGRLVKAGPDYIYTPKRGFTGKDAYVFKICATKGEQKGCSTIAFVATVE